MLLSAILIVSGIGLVCGVILVIAAKVMYVPVDETVIKVREVLPGANCGACGFAGCDDYAKQLGEGNGVKTNLCTRRRQCFAQDKRNFGRSLCRRRRGKGKRLLCGRF
ncbi:MAG: (Fe-S)-binding protein [Angelakisella sp.]